MNSQPDSKQPQQLHTGGGAAITGDVHTGGGDFVGRDFVQHIREHVAITGDGNIVGDSNTVIRQEGGDYAIQIGQLNVTLSLEDLRRILDPRYGHESGRRDFYTHAPRLEPERYVNRPQEYDQIKALLLSNAPTVGITTALRGAGGFGKTTLARVLCDDAEVQARFSDGILWATLGENPDVLTRLREWVTVLGGIISENAPTIPQLVNRLTDLLHDGAYLLLIDDVWDSAALAPFLCGGPCCAHLATTRNRATLPANVQAVAVDTMRPTEAIALLGYGVAAAASETTALQALAQRLGQWPLLLGIINGVLREMCAQGASLADALAHVAEGLAEEGLTAFDAADTDDRARAVSATLEVSLKRLSPADHARYTELAIFPEDTDIPATAAARLWGQTGGLSAFKTKDLFRQLGSASLVQAYNAERQTVRLHDVVRVYLAGILGPEDCAAAHRALLAAYRSTQTGEGWHTAPDDDYLYAHLAYHLDALAATDDNAAAELAALFTSDDWLQVRVAAADYTYDGYLADLEYVWRRAEAQVKAGNADALAKCVRCALIRATVNSLAGIYDPELVACAVAVGLWSPERALSLAAKIPDAAKRARIYFLLLRVETLSLEQRLMAQTKGLAAAIAIADEPKRAQSLAMLSLFLMDDLAIQLLEATREIEDEEKRIGTLWILASHLKGTVQETVLHEGLLAICQFQNGEHYAGAIRLTPDLTHDFAAEMLAAARVIQNEQYRAEALVTLVQYLPDNLLKDGLLAVQELEDDRYRTKALVALAQHLTGELVLEGLNAAREIQSETFQAQVLEMLAPNLPGHLLSELLWEIMQDINSIECRARVFAALAPRLTGDEQRNLVLQGLMVAQQAQHENDRAQMLAAVFPYLPADLLAKGLEITRKIQSEEYRARVLRAFDPSLRDDLLPEVLMMVQDMRDIGNEYLRAWILTSFIPHLSGEARENVLIEALTAARKIWHDENYKMFALQALAPYLTGKLLEEGLIAAQEMKEEVCRGPVLVKLAEQLEGDLLAQTLKNTRAIESEMWRAEILLALIPRLEQDLVTDVLVMLQEMRDDALRAKVLETLVSRLSDDLLVQALDMTRRIQSEKYRASALEALIEQLSGELLAEALAMAQEFQYRPYREAVLMVLAPKLTADVLVKGLAMHDQFEDQSEQVLAMIALAQQMGKDVSATVWIEALEAAREIENPHLRAVMLVCLAWQLEGPVQEIVLTEGVTAVLAIGRKFEKVVLLAMLIPHLADNAQETTLTAALDIAQSIESEVTRAEALTTLIPHLKGDTRDSALVDALATVRAIWRQDERTTALVALTPYLTGDLLAEGLEVAREIDYKCGQVQALSALVPRLNEDMRETALMESLSMAQGVGDGAARAHALAILAPQFSGEARQPLLASALEAALLIKQEQEQAQKQWEKRNQQYRERKMSPSREPRHRGLRRVFHALPLPPPRVDPHEIGKSLKLALTAMAPYLTGDLPMKGLAVAREIEVGRHRAEALAALFPCLTSDRLSEALMTVEEIVEEGNRTIALAALAPRLSDDLLWESRKVAQGMQDVQWRATALGSLLPYFKPPMLQAVQQEYKTAVLEILRTISHQGRKDILGLLSANIRILSKDDVLSQFEHKEIFNPDLLGLTPAAIARIAEAVIDVCRRWDWV